MDERTVMEKTDNQKAAEFECRVRKLARELYVAFVGTGAAGDCDRAFTMAESFERLAEERWEKLP